MATADQNILEEDRQGRGERIAADNNGAAAVSPDDLSADPEMQQELEEGLRGIGNDLRDYVDKHLAEVTAGLGETALGDAGSFERASIRGAIFGAVVLALGVWLGGRNRS